MGPGGVWLRFIAVTVVVLPGLQPSKFVKSRTQSQRVSARRGARTRHARASTAVRTDARAYTRRTGARQSRPRQSGLAYQRVIVRLPGHAEKRNLMDDLAGRRADEPAGG